MPDRPTIAPGQVWRRPNGLHVKIASTGLTHARLGPMKPGPEPGTWRLAMIGRRDSYLRLDAIGGRGWVLVAEGVRDPRATPCE